MTPRTKPELTWSGKDRRQTLEPGILLEDPTRSYHATRGAGDDVLVQGDNLLALKALERDYAGKVRCVYIDPPYNTGSAFDQYDDGVEHSRWLSLLRERLELLRGMLRPDGSIWISIDDNEAHYLKVLGDEIFGRANFVANIVWEKRTSRENRRVFSFNHDHILVFARDKPRFEATRNLLAASSDVLRRYKNPDGDPRGPWQSISATAQAGHATASQFYELAAPNGRRHRPPEGRCWLYTERRMQEEVRVGNVWFGKGGDGVPRLKKFTGGEARVTPETLWRADEVGTNDEAKKHLLALFDGESRFDTPKPEALVARILEIATDPGDVVVDAFVGSGTTAAVATKMRRRWLAVEIGEHASTCVLPRLRKVVDGQDPGGVTAATRWEGGGGFRFFHLAPSSEA